MNRHNDRRKSYIHAAPNAGSAPMTAGAMVSRCCLLPSGYSISISCQWFSYTLRQSTFTLMIQMFPRRCCVSGFEPCISQQKLKTSPSKSVLVLASKFFINKTHILKCVYVCVKSLYKSLQTRSSKSLNKLHLPRSSFNTHFWVTFFIKQQATLTVPSRSRCWQNSAYLHLCHGGKSRDFRDRHWKLCQVPWLRKKNDIADVVGIVLLCVFDGGFTSHLRLRRFFLGCSCFFFFFLNTFLLCIFVPGGCLFIYFDGCHLVEAIFNRYG